MLRKIIGAFCFIMALGGLAGAASSSQSADRAACIAVAVIFAAIGLRLFLKKGKSPEAKQAEKAKKAELKQAQKVRLLAEHMAGLPLAEGVPSTIIFGDDSIAIESSGNTFRVSYDKVTDMQIKTSSEIQKQYVSSIGGAVGGAVLFGPLGAMVGGRAKEKKSTKMEHFFIITYLKEGQIDYLSFRVSEQLYFKAGTLIKLFKPKLSGSMAVDL